MGLCASRSMAVDAVVTTADIARDRPDPSGEEIEVLAERLDGALQLLWTRYGRSRTAEIGDRNLAGAQLAILSELCEARAVRISDLARSLQVRVPTASIAVRRLLRSGLVERSSDRADQRVVRVGITERGRYLLQQVRDIRARRMQAILIGLAQGEREVLSQAVPILARLTTFTPDAR